MKTTTVKQNAVREKAYPKLRYLIGPCVQKDRSIELVILFTSPKKGTVVHAKNSVWGIGDWSGDWAPDEFTDYSGPLTLEND